MKYRFERSFSGNYLYINRDGDGEEYKYETTGMMSLHDIFMASTLSYKELRLVIEAIMNEGKRIEEMGLDINGWLLNPEYVFASVDSIHGESGASNRLGYIRFIYFPEETGYVFERELLYLAEFLIENVDYRDRKGVDIAYEFYMKVYRKDYYFDSMMLESKVLL